MQAVMGKHRQSLRLLRRATKAAGVKVSFPVRRHQPRPKIISIRFAKRAKELALRLFNSTAAEKEMKEALERKPHLSQDKPFMTRLKMQRVERALLEQGIRQLLEAAELVPRQLQEKIEAFYGDRKRLRAIFNGSLQDWRSTAAFVTEWYNAHLNRKNDEAELRIPQAALTDPRRGPLIESALINLVRVIARHSRVAAKFRLSYDPADFNKSIGRLWQYRHEAGTYAGVIRRMVSQYEPQKKP